MSKPLAIVTGASSGIGFELASICAREGYDLVVAADMPEIATAAEIFRSLGADTTELQVDLSERPGVDALHAALEGRQVELLLANAGHGLGHGFSTRTSTRSSTSSTPTSPARSI
jgi:short-subunit dehydrogenase